MRTPREFAELLALRLQCAKNARKLPPNYGAGVRTDVEIICLEIEARDAEHVAAVRDLAPARAFGEWPDRPQGVPWPAAYGKYTSPPWYPNTKDIDPSRWADRVTETSAAAIRACQKPA